MFIVHAAPEKGRQRLIYLDTENGLTLGYDEVQEIPGLGMVGCEVRFADYREIEGVQIPFKCKVKYSHAGVGHLDLSGGEDRNASEARQGSIHDQVRRCATHDLSILQTKGTPLKTFFWSLLLSLMAGAALAGPADAQTNLAGTWQGRLEVAPGQSIAIHFVITAAPGGYSVVVTSPDEGAIRNVHAKSVTFADQRLTIDVPDLSGGYAGTLRNGVFEGEWSQEGSRLPLSLRPYEKSTLTQAEIAVLRGEWSGKFSANGINVTIVLRFSTGDAGALRAVMDIPEQGVKDWEARDVALDDGHFSVKVPAAGVEIKGQLKGEQIVGQWSQLGNSTPLTLKKGRHVAATSYLELTAAASEQLIGRWSGMLGPIQLVVRFETDARGRTLGFLDMPQQNVRNSPITEVELAGTKLTFVIPGFGEKYTGELAGSKWTGEFTQPGIPKPIPLVLTREK